jgi:hypothetical protein
MDSGELGSASTLVEGDFWFEGDAAALLPQMLGPVVGDLKQFREEAAPMKTIEDSAQNTGEEGKDEVQKHFEAAP